MRNARIGSMVLAVALVPGVRAMAASAETYVCTSRSGTTCSTWSPLDAAVEDSAEIAAANLVGIACVTRAGKTGSNSTAGDWATCNVDAYGGVWGAADQPEDTAEIAAMPLSMAGCVVRAAKSGSTSTAGDNATCNVDATGGLWTAQAQVEDSAHTTADVGAMAIGVMDATPAALGADGDYEPFQLDGKGAIWTQNADRAVAYGASPTAVTAGVYGATIADLEGRPYVNTSHPRAVHCVLSTTATTATQVTGCEVVASNSYYITAVHVAGDILNATATPWQITSGTSTDCTGATIVVAGYHPAVSGQHLTFPTPIKVTQAHGLCILDATVGTKKVTITGYIAP